MSEITLSIPDEALLALKVNADQMGTAVKLAGVPRTVFLAKLADYGVDTFRLTEAELQQETRLG